MKKIIFCLLLMTVFIGCADNTQQNTAKTEAPKTEAVKPTEEKPNQVTDNAEVIKRGTPLNNTTAVTIGQILENPKNYENKPVTVEGQIARVCQAKGCWMELTEKEGDPGLRISFKDYGFFVPTDSQGKKVKAEGALELKVVKKDEAEHYIAEGSKMKQNPDGSANIVNLVASGVEIYPAK
ncbi:MAG: DUF4920 domain-containing protein [Blastocatellia bacterium]